MNSPRVNGRREQSARDAGTEVPRWEAVGTDRVGGIAVNINTYPDRNQTKGSDSPPWPWSNQATSEGERKAPSDTLNCMRAIIDDWLGYEALDWHQNQTKRKGREQGGNKCGG
jgi:hypothetical protein